MSKLITALILLSSLFFSITTGAAQSNSGSLTISPSIQELEAKPGNSYDLTYTIENGANVPVTADITVETFKEGSIPGSATVVPFTPENDISSWVVTSKVNEFLNSSVTKNPVKVTVPSDAKPGAYYFAVVFAPREAGSTNNQDTSSLLIKTRIANLVFINIAGDKTKQPTINDFDTNLSIVDIFFDKLSVKFELEAKGSSFLRPSGNMFLVEGENNIVNLESNLSGSLILPGAKKSYGECYQNHIINHFLADKCSTGKQSKLPYFGQRQLELKLDYIGGNGQPLTTKASKNVLFFPWKLILLLLFIAIIILLTRRYLKKSKKNRTR